jgi:minor extracellular serine protease Vpr
MEKMVASFSYTPFFTALDNPRIGSKIHSPISSQTACFGEESVLQSDRSNHYLRFTSKNNLRRDSWKIAALPQAREAQTTVEQNVTRRATIMSKRTMKTLTILVMLLGTSAVAVAQNSNALTPPLANVSNLEIGGSAGIADVSSELQSATGEVQVVIRLVDQSLAEAVGPNAKSTGYMMSTGQQRSHLQMIGRKQDILLSQIKAVGGKEIGRISKVLNAVIVSVDASKLAKISTLPNVTSIRPVVDYQVDLSETVPQIGAAALQAAGIDGTGVRVAVLDSGIDYTHYNLGGSGDVPTFNANDPTIIEPGTFPTLKVVGGYDFVGEVWPGGALSPDPDPLDKGSGAGHGTHVADIIAGKSSDGLHKGVAPGASLYAVGVCAKVSTSCSGIALLEGMDFALDPNGDGRINDAVDVINLSLGSAYGQREDDLSAACTNAVRMGVVVVASAGNNGDKPYVLGSPSSTPEVISVAQTQVPSSQLYLIEAGSVTAGGSWQPWSAEPALVTGPLQYGDGAGGNLTGCSAFDAGSLTGTILLLDRGTCSISIKVSNGAAAGALAVVVANNASQAPGDLPPDFSYGGGTPSVAGYSITRADGLALRGVVGQTATIDPASSASLVRNMVSTSSRGPNYSYNAIKPDVGAPGASVSAQYGTGNGEVAFGGTSGAAPMVSGSAALLIQKFPRISPYEVKARLMNTAETNIGINPVSLRGYLAPITRIGGGEVRVDKAISAGTAAWDVENRIGSLSFGYNALIGSTASLVKNVEVRNYANRARTYTIKPSFRYADDAASGAVRISTPGRIQVPANGTAKFSVLLMVDVTKLPGWYLNGGYNGGDGYLLQEFEYDGYINISDASDNVHLAWQILPHRSANVKALSRVRNGAGTLTLSNSGGAVGGQVDVFDLLGTSDRIPRSLLPRDGDDFAVIDLKNFGARLVGIGGGQYGIQFAVNTYGTRAHPNYPAEFDVVLDIDRNGTNDFVIYNLEYNGFGATGQNVVAVKDLATNVGHLYFYTDADLNSGNAILTAPLAALGATPDTQFNVSVYACDNYFTGFCTDAIEGITYTPGVPRYNADSYWLEVPQGGKRVLNVAPVRGGNAASPSQTGLLLMYRDARQQQEADTIKLTP